jgi:hypothetical protein
VSKVAEAAGVGNKWERLDDLRAVSFSNEDFDLLHVTLSSLYTFVVFALVFWGFSKFSMSFFPCLLPMF